jgi:hypothetical protein
MDGQDCPSYSARRGHSLIELVAAMVCSAVLLAGLGSVMFIASEVAYAPTASVQRIEAAQAVADLADELRYATRLIERTPRAIEFVVADRDGDQHAERIRYEWSGVAGEPLEKTLNGSAPTAVVESVEQFLIECIVEDEITQLDTTELDPATGDTLLISSAQHDSNKREIRPERQIAQWFNVPSPAAPPGAVGWNATRIEVYCSKRDTTLVVGLRHAGDSYSGPTSHTLGEVQLGEENLSGGTEWNDAEFANSVRGLALDRAYALTFTSPSGAAAELGVGFNLSAPGSAFESVDGGASWRHWKEGGNYAQIGARVYGTYIVPGPSSYNVTRKFIPRVRIALQADELSHSRVESGIELVNRPELLSAYWRADFTGDPTSDAPAAIDPTAADANGDDADDWEMGAAGTFDVNNLAAGVWTVAGQLETRPGNDFTGVTIVTVCCRGGATLRLNADRQDGLYAPLTLSVASQGNGTQRLALEGESSAGWKTLCAVADLEGDPSSDDSLIQVRLMIVPAHDLVNLCVNGIDQGTFTYPTYGPASTDRFLSLSGDASQFDYVEVRVTGDAVIEAL